jgi:hypothetical protein
MRAPLSGRNRHDRAGRASVHSDRARPSPPAGAVAVLSPPSDDIITYPPTTQPDPPIPTSSDIIASLLPDPYSPDTPDISTLPPADQRRRRLARAKHWATIAQDRELVDHLSSDGAAIQALARAVYQHHHVPRLAAYDAHHLEDPAAAGGGKVRERIAKIAGLQAADSGPGGGNVQVQVNVLAGQLRASLEARLGHSESIESIISKTPAK